ncbi:MAG TPA: DNA polymerase I [Anaerolineaceae bacterium]|nr:DNA polymerase I [Anaerolineaceae bacterium]
MPPTLYLIDGHGLAYRTYFALTAGTSGSDRWQTATGEPIAGVYGFTSVLLRILEQEKPEYLAVAFDTGRTFRDDLYTEYKATRSKMPDDLFVQMKRIRQVVDTFKIPRLEVEGYEADDVLGSVARQAVAQGLGVKIITGDRDLLQLVEPRVVVNLSGNKLSEAKDYFPEDVVAHLGVRPDQVVDYKALVGDTSDNIPGVSGIGEKTAVSLLKEYDTLDQIYANLDKLKEGARKRLEAGRDSAYLSRDLARIHTDVQVTLELEKARTDDFDPQEVDALFRELEFRTLAQRLANILKARSGEPVEPAATAPSAPAATPAPQQPVSQQLSLFGDEVRTIGAPTPAPANLTVHVVDNEAALADLVEKLNAAPMISVDTETTSTDPMRANLVGISLSVTPGEGYYIPVGHQAQFGPQLPIEQVVAALRGPMTDARIPKVGHNLKYDFISLKRVGLSIEPMTFDTMIAEWLINPDSRNLNLKNLAWIRLEMEMTHIQELIGKGKNQITMAEVPIQPAANYAAADAETSLRLVPVLKAELGENGGMRLLDEVEMPLVPVLADMEMAGIAIDARFFSEFAEDLRKRLAQIELQIYETCGAPFNINSTQQLSNVLFERLKLEPPDRRKRTSTGHFSTSADVLDEMRGQHEVVDWILEYRELAKLKSTYVDALPLQVNPATGRIHTSFNQTGTVTGRLASSDPNLQNIPTRSELGARVRHGFVAGEGLVLLSVDYSQIELRLVAHMSGDEAMLAAFRAGQDIHATTAAAIYSVPLEKVSKDQRRNAKGINFGLMYGISPFGLSRYTGLTLAESENFTKAYFQQFPGVKRYLDGIRRQAAQQGYVETLLGRRRYFPALKNLTNPNQRNREEREAINAPIQGTAADIMKLAMCAVPGALKKAGLRCRLLLQVHDELVIECSRAELHETARVVQEVMETVYPLSIPLSTDARCGENWGDMRPIDEFRC